jgi:hypothetical protein
MFLDTKKLQSCLKAALPRYDQTLRAAAKVIVAGFSASSKETNELTR